MLASDGIGHRRLFVWVNEQELVLDGARSRVEMPVSIRPLPGLAAGGAGLAHPAADARARAFDSQRKERGLRVTAAQSAARAPTTGLAAGLAAAPSRRPLAAGMDHALGGVTLKPLPAGTAFPPRIPGVAAPRPGAGADRPVLVVEIDVPAAMLHEGINALACTLVPGPASRRIERAVSFLHVAAAPAPSRAPTMPGRRTVAPLPPAIAAVLAGRAVALPAPPRKKEKPKQVRAEHMGGAGRRAQEGAGIVAQAVEGRACGRRQASGRGEIGRRRQGAATAPARAGQARADEEGGNDMIIGFLPALGWLDSATGDEAKAGDAREFRFTPPPKVPPGPALPFIEADVEPTC